MRSARFSLLIGSLAVLALAAFGSVAAWAEPEEPPLYNGWMGFKAIEDPDGPEEYSWRVQIEADQELKQVDDRHATVFYDDGHHAFTMTAEQARDATGAEVPTSFAVTAPDLITLTVHHRDGNPAAGGAPFDYPVTAGSPFTVGPSTVIVMPEGEQHLGIRTCVVPKLTGRTLAATRTKLTSVGCRLGAVRGKRSKGVRVIKQFRAPGTVLADGTMVAVKLGG